VFKLIKIIFATDKGWTTGGDLPHPYTSGPSGTNIIHRICASESWFCLAPSLLGPGKNYIVQSLSVWVCGEKILTAFFATDKGWTRGRRLAATPK